MVEEVSILAADKRRKDPREIPRPGAASRKADTPAKAGMGGAVRALAGMAGMQIRVNPPAA